MTPQKFAKAQRDYLIQTEKESAITLLREFENLRENISEYLTTNLTGKINVSTINENSFLEKTLVEVNRQIDLIRNPFTRIITRGQQKVVNFASNSLRKFLDHLVIDGSSEVFIFSPPESWKNPWDEDKENESDSEKN